MRGYTADPLTYKTLIHGTKEKLEGLSDDDKVGAVLECVCQCVFVSQTEDAEFSTVGKVITVGGGGISVCIAEGGLSECQQCGK